jgi:hypothetical protein
VIVLVFWLPGGFGTHPSGPVQRNVNGSLVVEHPSELAVYVVEHTPGDSLIVQLGVSGVTVACAVS